MNHHPPLPGTSGSRGLLNNTSSLSPLGRMILRCVFYPHSQSAPGEASSMCPRGNLHERESESHSVVSNSLQLHGLYSPWNSPGQNTGVGSLSLLQGIFPTQGSNPGLPHCRWILYQLSHKGSPLLGLGLILSAVSTFLSYFPHSWSLGSPPK